jgi:hypothetical protein
LVTARIDYFMLFEFTTDNRRRTLQFISFLGTFTELRKDTISFVVSFCPSAWSNLSLTERIFLIHDIWGSFEIYRENSSLKNLTRKPVYMYDSISFNSPQNEKCFTQHFREKKNTRFTFNSVFFRKSCRLWDNVEKFGTPRQVTDDKLEHAQCMLDTKVYKRTIIIYNIYCFTTAIILTRTRLIFTLYFHSLSCLFLILLPFVFWHQ